MDDKSKTRILATALQTLGDAIFEAGVMPAVQQQLARLCELRGFYWCDAARVADETNGFSVSESVRQETIN